MRHTLISLNAIVGGKMMFIFGGCDSLIFPLLGAFTDPNAINYLSGKHA